MYNRGEYKNRVYFSHGDFTEGFMFSTYPKPIGQNEGVDGVDSGWFEIKGPLLKEFNRIIKTGKFKKLELKDDQGKKHSFSIAEVQMLQDEFISQCFEKLAEASEKQKRTIVKSIGLEKLAKMTRTI